MLLITDSEICDQQLDAAEKSNQWLAQIDTAMRELVAQGGDASDLDAKSISRQIFSDMNMEITDDQKDRMKSDDPVIRAAAMEEVATNNADRLSKGITDGLKEIGIAEGGETEAILPLDRLSEMLNTAALGGDGTGGGSGSGSSVLRVEGTLNVKGDGSESAKLNIKNFIETISSGDLQKLNSLLQNAIS